MKVKFNTEELQKVISQLAAVVSKKATSPVYEHVRLYATPSSTAGKFDIAMVGVDVDASLTRYFLKAETDGAVDVLLPYGKLQEIVSNISKAQVVTIELDDETKAVLRADKLRAVIRTMPVDQWPPVIDRPETVKATIGLPGFKEQIEAVAFAVPKEASKFVVTVVKIEATPEHLRLVATDGFRIAVATSKQNAGTFSLQVPKTALDNIKKLEGTKLSILETEAGFYFETTAEDGTYLEVLTATRISGEFPPYERVLPKSHVSEIIIEKAAFQEALACIMPLADKDTPVIDFTATENGTTFVMAAKSSDVDQSNATAGMFINTADNEIDAKVSGPAVAFSLNGAYLREFIDRATGPLSIKVGTGTGTIVDFLANGDNYRYLQMQATK